MTAICRRAVTKPETKVSPAQTDRKKNNHHKNRTYSFRVMSPAVVVGYLYGNISSLMRTIGVWQADEKVLYQNGTGEGVKTMRNVQLVCRESGNELNSLRHRSRA